MISFKLEDIWILVLCKIGHILKVSSTFFNNLFFQKEKGLAPQHSNQTLCGSGVHPNHGFITSPDGKRLTWFCLAMLAYIIAAWGSKSKPLCRGAETTCLAELISPTKLSKLLYLFATCPNLLAVILLFLNIIQRLLWLCALVFSSTSEVVCLKRPNTSNEVSLSCWRHIDTSFSNPISAFGIDFPTIRKIVFHIV